MKTKIMTNAQLQKEFYRLNERFFDGRLSCEVRFQAMPGVDGLFNPRYQRIAIKSSLKSSSSLVSIVLLHEMAHADLELRGYRGYPGDGGHGMLFQVELDKLYRMGCYDGLL